MIGGNRAGAGRRRRQRRADAIKRIQRTDAAGDSPIHRRIIDIIVIGVKAAGMNRQRSASGQGLRGHFGSWAAGSIQNFHVMRRTGIHRKNAGEIVGRGGVIRRNLARAGCLKIQCRSSSRCCGERADATAHIPVDREIAEIVAAGVITRGMDCDGFIGRHGAILQFGAIAGRAFNDFDGAQRAGLHGNGAGGVTDQRVVDGGDHAGADSRGGKGAGNAGRRIQPTDAAGNAPIHHHIIDIIVIAVETAGMHEQRLAGQQRTAVNFSGEAACTGKDFNTICCAGNDGNIAGHVVGRGGMIGRKNSRTRQIRFQGRGNAGHSGERADVIGHTPGHRIIAEVIAAGIIAGGMHGQRLIGGQSFRGHLRGFAGGAFDNLNAAQRPSHDGNRAGGIVQQGRVITGDHAGASRRRREARRRAGRRGERANAAANAPRDADVTDIIAGGVIAAGVNVECLAGGQIHRANFGGVATGRIQNFNAIRRPERDRNVAGHVVRCSGMVGADHTHTWGASIERRARAQSRRENTDTIADGPIHRKIAKIIVTAVKTRRMHHKCLVRGQRLGVDFRSVTGGAVINFDVGQIADGDGYRAGRVIAQSNMISGHHAGTGGSGGKSG
ncbi:MAG: hypothetical protein ALAOOOJD_01025 [bacterium]|nr:hypothetical protein [bacterium]